MRRLTLAAALLLPVAAFAAGSDSTTPPKPTETTTKCAKGQVWDTKSKACVDAQSGSLDDNTRFGAVRELAYAGRYDEAMDVLHAMHEGQSDRVLTYLGFITRKSGDMAGGMRFYAQALAANPDNILARSYMGQALVEQGETAAAARQLVEIRARGGTGTWAEASLARAVGTGETIDY